MKNTKILEMLDMQDNMNSVVNSNWREEGNEWYRAIWIELAEAMDHVGWKWWKKKQINQEQLNLEIVDILHFVLSIYLEEYSNRDELEEILIKFNDMEFVFDDLVGEIGLLEALELGAEYALRTKSMDLFYVISLAEKVGMTFDELYERYVMKNVLNLFRQANGYKEGTYVKIWGEEEDNIHLIRIAAELSDGGHFNKENLYDALQTKYHNVLYVD